MPAEHAKSAANCRLCPFIRILFGRWWSRFIPAPMKKSILLRSIYLLTIGAAFSILLVGALRYSNDYSKGRVLVEEKGVVIAQRLSAAIALPLWDFNEEQIRTTILLELADPDVLAITITSPAGKVTGFRKGQNGEPIPVSISSAREPLPDADVVTSKEILHNDILIGIGSVYMSFSPMLRKVSLTFLWDFIVALVLSAILLLIIFLSLKRNVIDPVIFLQNSVINLSRKDFSTRISTDSEDEIGALAKSFNQMAATIEDYNRNLQSLVQKKTDELMKAERLAAAGKMIAGMAHELNTPLGTALTAISHDRQLLEDIEKSFLDGTMTKEGFRRFIDSMKSGIDLTNSNLHRTAVLIDMFKRAAIDDTDEDRETFIVKNLIYESIYSIEPHFAGKSIIVTILCGDSLMLTARPRLFSHVIACLTMNAILHGFENRASGVIKVTAETSDNEFMLSFYDDGNGIEPDRIERIFEPFYTTKRNQGGTGLGLTIVHNIVHHNFGGSIACESTQGNGTLFTIRIPLDRC